MAENSETESDKSSSNDENPCTSLHSDIEDNAKTFGDEILPYENEPLASSSNSDDSDWSDEYERDDDGLTPSVLEQRYENNGMISSWCSCTMCSHETLISAQEFRCCKEIDLAYGKLTFDCDSSIEHFQCITLHPDYLALTNRTVLTLVGPLLKDKSGKSYGRKRGSAENEYLRAVAYRWLIRWIFGILGWDNSRPLPACIYHNIRTRYVTTQTTGYKSAEERD